MKHVMRARPCPVCGAAPGKGAIARLFTQRFEAMDRSYTVAECRACGHIHQNPAWDEAFYDGLYAEHLYDPFGHKFYPAQVKRYREVAKVISTRVGSGARILDYGSYDGSFIEWLNRHTAWAKRCAFVGYDISLRSIPPGANFYNSLAVLRKKEEKFDLITSNQVLEHLVHPREVVTMLTRDFLKEGGRMVIEVPNIARIMPEDFSPFHIQHVNYFTPKTMADLLMRSGLMVETVRTFMNADVGRDPSFPTLLVVAQKDAAYHRDGEALRASVREKREAMRGRILSRTGSERFRMAIAACGDTLSPFVKLFPKAEVVGLFDNDKKIWEKKLFGVPVQPMPHAAHTKAHIVVVCTLNRENAAQIKAQLARYVPKAKIVTFFD